MIQIYIEYVLRALIGLTIIFIVIKYVLIKVYTAKKNASDIFVRSLYIISKQEIKNTFNMKVSKYYAISNIVNKVAYLYYLILLFALLFLKIL
jgi:hypothetical protein